ncbi:hypothetical protein [Metabacillus sediminilitoris]|uniref:Uncharacterized protein n=1 Tax=Metabacillus sediminilitoris TaxID=2567941 RepID=A0A4S4BTT9_9BACI|nr:hypothetical protein [Metabacillus sediminilitoris]QGQ44872.1 hypothetical protein GMB29_06100 [Metabacillus sediminilitoris]THF78505.1 hypothetical protein E6W99_15125 [Metabacillus sediminilitoris]
MAGTELLSDVINMSLAILWILLFLQNKRKRTVNFVHIILLVFALVILPISLYQVINSWWFM